MSPHHPSRFTRARWRPPKDRNVQNKTENRFEANVLKPRLWNGEIIRYLYQPWKFRFGTDFTSTYTPDFVVFRADGYIEIIDVKGSGGWEDATRVKIKSCAALFPEFIWLGQMESRRKGMFEPEEF